ncbi:TonB-dependent receptor [uncultured Sunxiuqinia sp.]|uniref:TonB-dependent receptor n=1 Tax=Sunxiuqinia rutila TaxID=1397841 RepID=UPI00261AF784|nr:TonB-dependent receptor [uncultured Sunxiuqinia sp.]
MKKKLNLPIRGALYPRIRKMLMYMKITCLFILLAVAQVFAATSYAQTANISIHLTNATVEKALQSIEDQTEYYFLYSRSVVDVKREVNIEVEEAEIDQLLNSLFEGTNVSYKIDGRQIVLSSSENRTVQQKTISGNVTDSSGQPLPGVTVVVKGTTIGVVTDFDGNYSLSNVADDATLVFSFVGMRTQEIVIGNQSTINVVMAEDAIGIEEVVAVGYGVQKRANLAGSVATIGSEEMVRVPIANSGQALAGKVAGLVVKENTGKPGAAPSISIRNYGSPLIIVDGVEQANYHNIDPNEIESFTILKDASAAIYGSKAGNGVILITTKRGKTGKPRIEVNSSFTAQTPTSYPQWLSTWDFAQASNEIADFRKEVDERNGKEYVYAAWNAIPGFASDRKYTDADIEAMRNGATPNTDWLDATLNKYSPMQNHNISVSGANERVGYFISAAYTNQIGYYKSDDSKMNRYNVRSNIDINVAKNLNIGLDLSVRNTDIRDTWVGEDQIWMSIRTSMPFYPSSYPDPTKIPYAGWDANTLTNTTNADLSGYKKQLRSYKTGAMSMKYIMPFIKGLSALGRVNYIGDSQYNKNFGIPFTTWRYDEANDLYYNPITQNQDYGFLDKRYESERLTYQFQLDYNRSFGDHNVKALAVYEAIDYKTNQIQGTIKGFISPAIDQIFAGNPETKTLSGTAYEEGNVSYVGRLNYDYKGKYLLESTIRTDGSSRFSPDVRWGTFPSVLAAWRMSEENFIKEYIPAIDNLKLRTSYSQTGYDRNAAAYQYLTTYSFSGQYVMDGITEKAIVTDGLVNPDVTWETMTNYNAGLDVSLWRGKLGVEFDYFYRLRDDILATRLSTLPNTFGATLPQENLEAIDNRGFELVVKHSNQINDFKYNLSGNISWTRAKYVRVEEQEYEDEDEARLYTKTDRWTNIRYGYEVDGWLTDEDLAWTQTSGINYDNSASPNSTLAAGLPKYVDQNDDRVIDWRDQVEIGRGSTPEIMYGINGNAYWKNFDVSMLWQGATNYDIVISDHMLFPVGGGQDGGNIPQFLFDGRWTPENPNSKFPRLTDGAGAGGYISKTSTINTFSAGYIRLKNLSIGYSLPKSLLNKVKGLSNARVYFAGYNLLTFDKLSDFEIDPERGGNYNGRYIPQYKSFSLGLNITLE